MAWVQLPTINFSGLELKQSGAPRRDAVRAQVTAALERHHCFRATYDEIDPELYEAVFGGFVRELYRLPAETRSTKNASERTFQSGHLGAIPGLNYESCAIADAHLDSAAERFTSVMWPAGHHQFRSTISLFTKKLLELLQTVISITLESLEMEKYLEDRLESCTYTLRMNEYVPESTGTAVGLPGHFDHGMITVICDNQVPGLQIQSKDDEWSYVTPDPNSYILVFGEAFQAWSNGRILPTPHRVMVEGNEIRHSVLFFSFPKDDQTVKAAAELVDEDHPLLFKPFNFGDYVRFTAEEASFNLKPQDRLRAFCGVQKQELQARQKE